MNKIISFFFGCLLLIFCFTSANFAQEKLAQTGMQFLNVISDGRAAALAGSVNSKEMQSSSLFFNPGTMGFDTSLFNAAFSLNRWIADISNHNFSLSFAPENGDYGVFGVSLQLVDYGEILGTIVANNDKGYEDIGNLSAAAFAAGFGYSKKLSDQFSVGGQIKWVEQSLGESIIPAVDSSTAAVENKLSVLAFDFGTLFKTGYKSLAFGMSVRNFSKEIKYVQEGFQLPLVFSIGISMDLMDFSNIGSEHSVLLSIDAIQARSQIGQVGFGLEYGFIDHFTLRGGYLTNNSENEYSVGVGVAWFGVQFDYAYSPFGVFGNISRLSVRFSY